MSHIINIESCSAGSYTKVRKQLNKALGGPEFWDYDKPMFTVDCSGEAFDKIQDKLGSTAGIEFLADHAVAEVVVEAAPEAAPEEEPEIEPEIEPEEEVAPAPTKPKPHNYWADYNKR